VVINIDNYSKYRGVGISMKFKKEDGALLVICLRNDIYYSGSYTIAKYPEGDKTSPQDVYDNCKAALNLDDFKDFQWGSDLVVKNSLDPAGFGAYNLAGLLTFHDPA
jgi:hypothetical protein